MRLRYRAPDGAWDDFNEYDAAYYDRPDPDEMTPTGTDVAADGGEIADAYRAAVAAVRAGREE